MPDWLSPLAWIALTLGWVSALTICADLLRGNHQHMWIMNLVWPITALYAGPLALWAYFRVGRRSSRRNMQPAKVGGHDTPDRKPLWQSAALATTHCGSGCTLGDLVAEWSLLAVPLVLAGHKLFAAWIADYILAFLFGIAFQYFTLKPMRHIGRGEALVEALKADTLSLSAWQLGMYGWMAIATFVIFGHELDVRGPVFWFMMQLGMLAGFVTSYPVNVWLLKAGIKQPM